MGKGKTSKTETATKEVAHSLYRTSFAAFTRIAFSLLYPGKELTENWHLDAIAFQLERVASGECRRLMINVPPRSLKSLMTSVFLPLWMIGHDPSRTILVVSHSLDLARDLSNQFRQLLADVEIQAIFPALSNGLVKDSELDIRLPQGGGRVATSVDSNITGRGGDTIILDDLADASDAGNEEAVEKVNTYVDNVLSTRLNDPVHGAMILVMQRLAINDPSAHLASQEPWTQLIFPAVCPMDQEVRLSKHETKIWEKGELLFSSRFSEKFLKAQQLKMGKAAYSAQYLQKPLPPGGGLIEFERFGFFCDRPKLIDKVFLSIDPASGADAGSYTAILKCLISNGRLYVFDVYRKKLNFPDLCKLIIDHAENNRLHHLVVEKTSNGVALLETLMLHFGERNYRQSGLNLLQPISPSKSKVARMEKAMAYVNAGGVLLQQNADWLPAFEAELRAFPGGKYDDQVDALSQAIDFYVKLESHSYYGSGKPPSVA